eukprot:15447661-Alexandrium_andersonii.AAC.1
MSATPRCRRCTPGMPRFARHRWRPELHLKGSPASTDPEHGTRMLRPVRLLRPQPLPYGS